jgi:hypothetical protein
MMIIIQEGDYTDTNTCIVGGMMRNFIDFNYLSIEYIKKSMSMY